MLFLPTSKFYINYFDFLFIDVSINSYKALNVKNLSSFHGSSKFYYLTCQLLINTVCYDMSRSIIDMLVCSCINSKNGIKLSIDKPLNNPCDLNIRRPAILRQNFGKELDCTDIPNNQSLRYTYGSGTGVSSVGMDPLN